MPTCLMAVVRDFAEVDTAVRAGAAIVQVAVPTGATETEAVDFLQAMLHAVGGRAETGVLVPRHPDPETVARSAITLDATGVGRLLVEAEPADDRDRLADAIGTAKLRAKPTALIRTDGQVLAAFARNRFQGVILTSGSQSGRLLDEWSVASIGNFVDAAHAAGLQTGLCGRLETPDVPRLLPLRPEFLVFGDGGPEGDGCLLRVAGMLRGESGLAPTRSGDFGTYTLFVRELVLPVEIGAYSFEHGRTQKVRFDVEAEVERMTLQPRTMADVFSYDVIMDAIRASIDGGHVQLSETLAESVAAMVVAHPRVVRVRVRVEKLELGPAGVGVEVEHRADRLR